MQWINKLHSRYKNQAVWIAGSGPSLDTYPDDFLDYRLAVVLHNAYLKFPNSSYRYANESPRVEYFKKYYPEYLKPPVYPY